MARTISASWVQPGDVILVYGTRMIVTKVGVVYDPAQVVISGRFDKGNATVSVYHDAQDRLPLVRAHYE